ncbi:MAG: segregation/condensation protein A [Candidatus Moraniibacteriota bacterium]
MAYAVRLEQFEGPLELLWQLIEKEKLDVTRVSLATVADQYLEYIARQGEVPLSQLAQFLSVASRLLLLKSRALLPLLEFTDAEEESIEDLEWQLREYRKFREASVRLGGLFAKPARAYSRESFLGAEVVFLPDPGVQATTLADAFRSVLGEIPLLEKLDEEEIKNVISLEEKMLELRSTLASRMEMSFRQMTVDVADRLEVIIAFLAVLELVKQRFIRAEQSGPFCDIALHHHEL